MLCFGFACYSLGVVGKILLETVRMQLWEADQEGNFDGFWNLVVALWLVCTVYTIE